MFGIRLCNCIVSGIIFIFVLCFFSSFSVFLFLCNCDGKVISVSTKQRSIQLFFLCSVRFFKKPGSQKKKFLSETPVSVCCFPLFFLSLFDLRLSGAATPSERTGVWRCKTDLRLRRDIVNIKTNKLSSISCVLQGVYQLYVLVLVLRFESREKNGAQFRRKRVHIEKRCTEKKGAQLRAIHDKCESIQISSTNSLKVGK